ncbi:MAG: hypothetical protein M1831_001606 [Alyxoria varia]|nr:MAG: hypothetical protein M1831_001606 [Alyxoria varia]
MATVLAAPECDKYWQACACYDAIGETSVQLSEDACDGVTNGPVQAFGDSAACASTGPAYIDAFAFGGKCSSGLWKCYDGKGDVGSLKLKRRNPCVQQINLENEGKANDWCQEFKTGQISIAPTCPLGKE